IIKYIIVEAGERSKEIQALLKLDEVGNIRSVLSTARNKLTASQTAAQTGVTNASDALRRHLDVKTLTADEVLAAGNPRRKIIGLAEIKKLEADTSLNEGVSEGIVQQVFNKQSALADLVALQDAQAGFASLAKKEVAGLLEDLEKLENDPALLEAIPRRSFVKQGLALVDGTRGPLCDKEWGDEEDLKNDRKGKLARSKQAEALQKQLLDNAAAVSGEVRRILSLVGAVAPLAKNDGTPEIATILAGWADHLNGLLKDLGGVESVV